MAKSTAGSAVPANLSSHEQLSGKSGSALVTGQVPFNRGRYFAGAGDREGSQIRSYSLCSAPGDGSDDASLIREQG